jgi:transposase
MVKNNSADCSAVTGAAANLAGDVRLRRAERDQIMMQMSCRDELIPRNHQARVIWLVVQKLDLSLFYEPVKAREGVCGRDMTDPAILISLWLYASTRGVGSARELDRLCKESKPFQWLCGGVSLNYHTISDFRTGHAAALDEMFTQVLASLVDKDLVKVHRISQDGTRVRACAGAAGFRGQERLDKALAEAKQHVEDLAKLLEDPAESSKLSARQKAARRRAAREKQERIEQAIARLPELKERQTDRAKREQAAAEAAAAEHPSDKKAAKKAKQGQVRVSTTDADARVMKMGNGGFNPAFNVQLSTDTESRAIIGVDVVDIGSDMGLAEPMREQVQTRTGGKVDEHLIDGGFLILEEIDTAAADGVTLFVPPKTPADPNKLDQRYVPKPDDTPDQAQWRQRMGTEEAKEIYKERASTIETVNADLKTHRGLGRFLVRGIGKARCVVVWSALAYNLLHFGVQMIT